MAETKQQEQVINEQNPENKQVAFFAGRANPPTPGHIKIMKEVIDFAENNNAIARIYLSSSYNKAKNISHITKDRNDSNLRNAPYHTHVKHKKYENPLMPDEKKNFVVEMLHNATGMDREKLEEIVVVSLPCQPLYFALSCVTALQPNIDKVFYFMGKEKDNNEREQREKNCFSISENDGETFYETGRIDGRYRCILVSREDDAENPAAGMSGSKIRLAVASAEAVDKNDPDSETNARDELQKSYEGLLEPEQINDLFDRIKSGILSSSGRKVISDDASYHEQFKKTTPSRKMDDLLISDDNIYTPSFKKIKKNLVPVTVGGRKTRRKKRKGKKKTYKRKHKKNKTKRKKIKRKHKKNLKKRTKKNK
uniref:Cytidyltransferase-like domain-containing protein n=1 Tax=viral metagenome TaxID=1070528 RepID=A0A6C0CNK7_9ZZZZ